MKQIITTNPYSSLLFISIACGLIWRIELEYHGWHGLIWLSYFHYAIPIGFIVFLYWANCFLRLSLIKRCIINLMAALYGILVFYLLYNSLTYNFAAGPLGMLSHMNSSVWEIYLYRSSTLFIIPSIPIGVYFILKIFHHKVLLKYVLLSVALICGSVMICPYLLELINHKGSHDEIHSVKSGLLIPFWIYSLGLLFINITPLTFLEGKPKPTTSVG